MPEATRIQYGRRENVLAIQIEGACTAVQAARVQRLLHECLTADTSDIFFDLSRASYMDSSFAGRLLGLALGNQDKAGPRICLQNMPSAVAEALSKMRVLHFFNLCDTMPVDILEWKELAALDTEYGELAELVIEAHERLMEADPDNAEMFARVTEGLREHRNPLSD